MKLRLAKVASKILARSMRAFDEDVLIGPRIRIRVNSSRDIPIIVEELPTKPVKKRLRQAVVSQQLFGYSDSLNIYIASNILRFAPLDQHMSYDLAVQNLKKYFADPQKMGFTIDPEETKYIQRSVSEREVSWLEVEPVDYKPLTAKGDGFTIYAEWGKFSVRREEEERLSEELSYGGDPYFSYSESSSPASARKLFKVLKANPTQFKSWTYLQFLDWLRANKITTKYRQSYW